MAVGEGDVITKFSRRFFAISVNIAVEKFRTRRSSANTIAPNPTSTRTIRRNGKSLPTIQPMKNRQLQPRRRTRRRRRRHPTILRTPSMELPPWDRIRRRLKEEAFEKLTAFRSSKSLKFTGFRRSSRVLPLPQLRLHRPLYPHLPLDWITQEFLPYPLLLLRPALIRPRFLQRRPSASPLDYSRPLRCFLIHPLGFLIQPLIQLLIQPRLLDHPAYLYRLRRDSRLSRR